MMLDAHPQLAIPPETGFLPAAATLPPSGEASRRALLDLILRFETWPDFHLSGEALAARLGALPDFTVSDGLRSFYALYAERFGKPRAGDKTPGYGSHLRVIRALLPEARFIHIIRDGRDVALSTRPLWFAPGRDMTTLARDWVERVRRTREQGADDPGYLEVRYEELVAAPRGVLERACSLVALPFDPGMLAYYIHAEARLDENEGRFHPDGRPWLTREQRRAQQLRVTRPLEPERAGGWRREMSTPERREFESVAGELLSELGYEA
jgi:hypothetical protein